MSSDPTPKDKKILQSYGQAGPYISLGLQFAAFILLFLYGGWWLDQKLSLTPLFTIVGTLAGAVLGFLRLYKTLMAQGQDKKKDEAN